MQAKCSPCFPVQNSGQFPPVVRPDGARGSRPVAKWGAGGMICVAAPRVVEPQVLVGERVTAEAPGPR